MNVIDLFAGCGGLSLGFMKAGYVVNKAVEFDPAIAQTYKVNHPEVNVIVDDITNVDTTGVFTIIFVRWTSWSFILYIHYLARQKSRLM